MAERRVRARGDRRSVGCSLGARRRTSRVDAIIAAIPAPYRWLVSITVTDFFTPLSGVAALSHQPKWYNASILIALCVCHPVGIFYSIGKYYLLARWRH